MRRYVAMALLGLAACEHELDDIPGATACRHRAVATVSASLTPVFTWSPTCTVGYLHVADSSGQPSWLLLDSGSAPISLNGIRSAITYGVPPLEAREPAGPAAPLVPGRRYLLLLRVGAIRGPGKFVDTTEFRP